MDKVPESKILYRDPDIQREIERVCEEVFQSREITKTAAKEMFGLGDAELTPEEMEEFRLFVEYASKRLANAALHIPGEEITTKEDAVRTLQGLKDHMGRLAFHDVAHALINYEDHHEDNSIVPAFLRNKKRYNDIEAISEEPRALMWDSFIGNHPIFISLMDPVRRRELLKRARRAFPSPELNPENQARFAAVENAVKNCDKDSSFETAFDGYQNIIYALVRSTNQSAFIEATNSTFPEEHEATQNQYDRIVGHLKTNPDSKLVAVARAVFENYEKDPKILFKEFRRIAGPLLDQLKKRVSKKE